MSEQYIYAVSRIRVKETTLLSGQDLETLLACGDETECLRVLAERGWQDTAKGAQATLAAETAETWETIREMVEDLSAFAVFLYANDFHNLKTLIKALLTGKGEFAHLLLPPGIISHEELEKAVRARDFSSLPDSMREPAEEAASVLLQTGDGQLCDVILDHAALMAIQAAGKTADTELIKSYAELTVAFADIKMAVRGQKTGKSAAALRRMLAPCESLDAEVLIKAAETSREELIACIENTPYTGAAQALRESNAAFERWYDNEVIELIRPQKYNSFTLAPLAAYILARQNEIRAVRLILSAKRNKLSESVIRERLREMYV